MRVTRYRVPAPCGRARLSSCSRFIRNPVLALMKRGYLGPKFDSLRIRDDCRDVTLACTEEWSSHVSGRMLISPPIPGQSSVYVKPFAGVRLAESGVSVK